MAMKPWYTVATPRQDLRDGKPLDASEFAVHLEHVRDGRAPEVYQNPTEFFDRTFLTKNLRDLACQTVRRLNGIQVATSAVFNLATQFGGGKTHALTLLYHLAHGGENATAWQGVAGILRDAGVTAVPQAATAIFVGTEFDSLVGRGGADGTPKRHTPWGEIAFQLRGTPGYQLVAQHDQAFTAPGGDVIERMLATSGPALILLDEVMNYVNRTRKSGLAAQLYTFLHNLSEVARSRDNVVLAVSIPASELEMTAEDQADFERFKKLLDRLGKAVIMSAEDETSEIIRRRLFEWNGLPNTACETIKNYEMWFQANKQQIPNWFPVETARDALQASYPFHPCLLSVFERKWQGLLRFQETRSILRLLALWVSKAYSEGYKGAHKDPLISLGTAPLEDPLFRAAVFEQLGESRLEPAVTTDITGKAHAHAARLDAEATAAVKQARLHRKVATVVFFESNGGQQRGAATLPEVRLAVAEPGLDIGNVEQCLEALTDTCYYLTAERNRYRFSVQANLNKILADRRASVAGPDIERTIRAEIHEVFSLGTGVERIYFPERSKQIPDRATLTLVIVDPDRSAAESATKSMMQSMTQESGNSSRTFKSALIWAVAESRALLADAARKYLAWKDIEADSAELKLDDNQQRQLVENVTRAERDLRESVWRSYKNIFLLAEDNTLRHIDLGLVHSSAARSLVEFVLTRLRQEDIVVDGVSPNFLRRYWPPALPEWSTKAVRDAFFASPKFPRLVQANAVRETISRGLDAGVFAYVGRTADGGYEPFVYKTALPSADVEIAADVYLVGTELAQAYLDKQRQSALQTGLATSGSTASTAAAGQTPTGVPGSPASVAVPGGSGKAPNPIASGSAPPLFESPQGPEIAGLTWTGEVPAQKWMHYYTKVLARFIHLGGLKITLTVEVTPPNGMAMNNVEETKVALRELGMEEDVVKVKLK